MSKRFTETDKWDRPWFRKLAKEYKLFWLYVCDKCDQIGVWYVDFEMASFVIGFPIDEQRAIIEFSKQIDIFSNGKKWFVKDFVFFQYGELTPTNNFHKSLLSKLSVLQKLAPGLPQTCPSSGAVVKEKEKEKVKDKEGGVGGFEAFYSAYPRHVARKEALKSFLNLNPDSVLLEKIMTALTVQKKSEQWTRDDGKYIPHPSTWLNQRRWEDELKVRNNGPRSILDKVMAGPNREESGRQMGGLPDL